MLVCGDGGGGDGGGNPTVLFVFGTIIVVFSLVGVSSQLLCHKWSGQYLSECSGQ